MLNEDLKNYERVKNASWERKLDCLLKETLKNFIRLNGVKFESDSFSMLHLSTKYMRTQLCAYLIDKIFIGNLNL